MKARVLLLVLIVLVSTHVTSAAISRIAFVRGSYIFLKDQKTGVIKRLVKGYYPSLSPDGKTLAFSIDSDVGRDLARQIQLLDLDTGKIKSFASLKGHLCFEPLWAPDGSKLAFHIFATDNWNVGVIDPANGEWSVISKAANPKYGVYLTSWTADSKSILCHDLDMLYQIDLDGDVIRKIPVNDIVDDPGYVSSSTMFSLSPDGKLLLFDTDELPDDPRTAAVWIYDLEQRTRKRLTAKNFAGLNPQWLSSGTEIVFTGSQWRRGRHVVDGIYKMKVGQTQRVLLVPNASQATFAEGS